MKKKTLIAKLCICALTVSMLSSGVDYLSTDLRQLPEMIRTETGLDCAVTTVDPDETAEQQAVQKTEERREAQLQKIAAAAPAQAPEKKEKPKRKPVKADKGEVRYNRKTFNVKKDETVLLAGCLTSR